MPRDANVQIQRIARAVEKVLRADGWINNIKVYDRRHLKKIAESMARKAAEPSRHVNQGFHNTSLTQCFLRQQLENDPECVMEMIASIVTEGKAYVGAGKNARLITVDHKSLALDLEARWASDDLSKDGMRDSVGQLFDLVVTQAYWDEQADGAMHFVYTQETRVRPGVSGERLVRVDTRTGSRVEVAYEGPKLSVSDGFKMSRFFNESEPGIVAHKSVVGDADGPSVSTGAELLSAIEQFHKATGKPAILVLFAGLLPGATERSSGHDLHAVTALTIEETLFLESRWGVNFDLHLNGLTADQVLHAMTLPEKLEEGTEYYDAGPPQFRPIDPSYPTPRSQRAPQFGAMQRQYERLVEIEKRAQNSPTMQAQERYFEELEKWEAKRAEHQAIFGEDLPFTVPPPRPPSTQAP